MRRVASPEGGIDAGGQAGKRRSGKEAGPENLKYVNDGQNWPHWQSLVRAESTWRLPEQTTREVRYFISSLPPKAPALRAATRLHWVLDVGFREDDSRIRRGHGPQNMARPEGTRRRRTLNLLPQKT